MRHLIFLTCLLSTAPSALAQDFYDVDILRTVDLRFHDADWWDQLENNYQSQTNILADLLVDGIVYPDVGVRIRGNTSYSRLPNGSQKVSLNVEVDYTHDGQDVLGYRNLNFNNAHRDPTFCRELVYFNILAEWIPSGRANHIVLTLNSENWGVYVNVQQYDKTMLREYFADEDGLRIKCPNKPNGPGLQYMGNNPSSYSDYEIKDDGGFADPIAELITICDVVDNTPQSNWPLIDQTFAIDPSIWTVALENLYSDDDSYVNKGADFMLYRNPVDGRAHVHQTDGNETWTDSSWSATYNFNRSEKPVLNNVLGSAEMRGRYFAHFRTVLLQLDWSTLNAEFTARRNMIDAEVQADPKKLYTYQQFLDNFTNTVNIGGRNGSIIGLKEYVDQRQTALLADPEVLAEGPVIEKLAASTDAAGDPVYITATITASSGVDLAHLYYRPSPTGPYERVSMADDGLSGDGAAGDDLYGALLPFTGVAGQVLHYYAGATAADTYSAQSFAPLRTEMDPAILIFTGPPTGPVVINEFLAKNNGVIQDPAGDWEDYVELYNRSASTVDLSGMFMTDDLEEPTKWQVPSGVSIDAGETLLIWADEDTEEGSLHADFKLSANGEAIGLFDTDGSTRLDSVLFGPQMADISTGRLEDGETLMVTFSAPTPEALNDAGTGWRAYDQLDPSVHPLPLTCDGSGLIGTAVTFTTTNLVPGFPALIFWGASPDYSPLRTMVLLLDPLGVFVFPADGTGTLTLAAQIPDNPQLIGFDLFVQTYGKEAAQGIESGSNAIHLTIDQ